MKFLLIQSIPSTVDENNYFTDASLANNEPNALSVDLTGKVNTIVLLSYEDKIFLL